MLMLIKQNAPTIRFVLRTSKEEEARTESYINLHKLMLMVKEIREFS